MIFNYLLLFIIFSIIGGIIDTAYVSFVRRKFSSQCFAWKFFAAIYGFGGLIFVALTETIKDLNMIYRLAIYAAALTMVEYIGSWICEKTINRKIWDYSHLPFNFQGRISLQHTAFWIFLSAIGEFFYWKYLVHITTYNFMPLLFEILALVLFLI